MKDRHCSSPKPKLLKLRVTLLKLQQKLKDIEHKLADTTLYEESGKTRLTQLLQQQTDLKRELAEVEESWIETTAELEAAGEES